MVHEPRKVLLIERNGELRDMTARVLGAADYQIQHLPEDSDPVAFAELIQPQAIVIRHPFLVPRGPIIVHDLLKNPRTSAIPVVVICALEREANTVAALSNVSEMLVAPYRIAALRAAVARALVGPWREV